MGQVTQPLVPADGSLPNSTNTKNAAGKEQGEVLTCPACGALKLRRTSRKGFLQRVIYSRFGYYPWECSRCMFVQLSKNRGVRHHHRKSND